MLFVYVRENDRLTSLEAAAAVRALQSPGMGPWIDLILPTPAETASVQQNLGITIPTREEMQEIEMSSRLYVEDGAEFMTVVSLSALDTDEPVASPMTFIIKGQSLVTVRYEEPKPIQGFILRVQKPGAVPVGNGEQIMFGLVEAMVDRLADALERIGGKLDSFSRTVFRSKAGGASGTRTRDFQALIEQIGREGDLLGMVHESLISMTRLLSYHSALEDGDKKTNKDMRERLKTLQRDVSALTDHTTFLSGKINFMLDSTLGLINLEQSHIIKVFSIAAVCLMPPTLVASVYGMNFKHMPELDFEFGYPMALLLMLVTAIVPVFYFKRIGWL